MAASKTIYNSIIQWNCRSIFKRMYLLRQLVSVTQPFVICLQETFVVNDHILDSIKLLFADFNFYFNNRARLGFANPGGGVAILVHKSIPQQLKPLRTHLEAVAVEVLFRGKPIDICSLYLRPCKTFTVNSLKALSSELGQHHLILGDLNAHNTLWGSVHTNDRGQKVSDFINDSDNVLLNTGEPTHISDATGRTSNIDISLSSPHLSLEVTWSTYTDSLGSNHVPIIIKIGAINSQDNSFTPLCKYRTKNVDMSQYTELATISTEGDTADEKLRSLKSSILTAAELSLPKCGTNKRRILVPWWTPECRAAITERNRAYRAFNTSPTEANMISYKKHRANARRIVKAAKRSSWQDFISKITKDTPTTEIWNHIKRINGKSYSSPIYLSVNHLL